MLADALDDDLILSSSLLPASDTYTRTSYWDALVAADAVFRISVDLWVLQGWDGDKETLQLGSYFHLVYLPRSNNEYGVSCTCPRWKAVHACIHQDTLFSFIDALCQLPLIAPFPTPPAVLLRSTPFNDKYIFSCTSAVGRYESGKRVVVTLQQDGRWHCYSCRYSEACKHKPHAKGFVSEAGLTIEVQDGHQVDHALELTISHFVLEDSSQCVCGFSIIQAVQQGHLGPPVSKTAVLYGINAQRAVTIELLPCPVCHHSRRHIGPDLRDHGVFNWNNAMLFSHELLNAYTNSYTASETPFSAFCLTVRRSYQDSTGDEFSFCSDDTFVRVWFAFTRRQCLDSGMQCPTCGSSPDIVIADGVSLGTHVSKLTKSISPPTSVDGSSEQVDSISSYRARHLPAVPQKEIRTIINKILDATVTHIPDILPDMSKIDVQYPELSSFIHLYFRIGINSPYHRTYRDLIQQIAAPDIILQLVPMIAIAPLQQLREQGDAPNWLQSICPAFGAIVNAHIWKRRIYSKLRYDNHALDRDAEEMGDCNKFYKTYAKNKLTGGILVLWCTHSICLGFHSIPVAEGRNDVFSAIYTRFPVAPKVIIYDFACQLAPYSFVREARYFQHTRFLIDEMHAHDHTRCGKACFASNAMRFDDRVRAVNTSAAECGNKGIKRIRKSVSFMVHDHAVQYTKVFLDIWNRNAINRMHLMDTK
ncbi:hypothetical protein M405DRAFT_725472 [Rhizopogon salebrosus TDB-379]|nr:hypothetical protein M405DRAFT_725472 [Rhizopogon salebrosus TDB-379]